MHRYPPGGRSKATATTLCQKCLQRGHYSYECKTQTQERPYQSRPSRTQQLANPKLAPKLTSDTPNDLLRTKGVADEQLAKKKEERKLLAITEDVRSSRRSRSRASSWSSSVSTISTNESRSPSPRKRSAPADRYYTSQHQDDFDMLRVSYIGPLIHTEHKTAKKLNESRRARTREGAEGKKSKRQQEPTAEEKATDPIAIDKSTCEEGEEKPIQFAQKVDFSISVTKSVSTRAQRDGRGAT